MQFLSMKTLSLLKLGVAACLLCLSRASIAQQNAQADLGLNSEMGVLVMVLALVLAFTVVARRAPHDSTQLSASAESHEVKVEHEKPTSAAVLHLPERNAANTDDHSTDDDPAGLPPSRIAS